MDFAAGETKNLKCPVCNYYLSNEKIVYLPCNDLICKECFELFKTSSLGEFVCPSCNMKFSFGQIAQQTRQARPTDKKLCFMHFKELYYICLDCSNRELCKECLQNQHKNHNYKVIFDQKTELLKDKIDRIKNLIRIYYQKRSFNDQQLKEYLNHLLGKDFYDFIASIDETKDNELLELENLKSKIDKPHEKHIEILKNFQQSFPIKTPNKQRKIQNRLNHNFECSGKKSFTIVLNELRGTFQVENLLRKMSRLCIDGNDTFPVDDSVKMSDLKLINIPEIVKMYDFLIDLQQSGSLFISGLTIAGDNCLLTVNEMGVITKMMCVTEPVYHLLTNGKKLFYIESGLLKSFNFTSIKPPKLPRNIVDTYCDSSNNFYYLTNDSLIQYSKKKQQRKQLNKTSRLNNPIKFCQMKYSYFIIINEISFKSNYIWIYDNTEGKDNLQQINQRKKSSVGKPSSIISLNDDTFVLGHKNLRKLEIIYLNSHNTVNRIINLTFKPEKMQYSNENNKLFISEFNHNKIYVIENFL